jgi:hypothetical protein
MTRWEYEVVTRPDLESFRAWLNRLGADGWEAVSANCLATAGTEGPPADVSYAWIALLKRPRE